MDTPDTRDGVGLDDLARRLDHHFANQALLVDAITHPSLIGMSRNGRGGQGVANMGVTTAYERLEFLGDRVLGLVIAEWLLERFPDEREGDLAKRHAALVQRKALSLVADQIGLGSFLRLSPGEADHGGRANRAILADACEAVLGAMYIDAGLEPARRFIRRHWTESVGKAAAPPQDPKTALQEWAQARGKPLPAYEVVERTGPPHEPVFLVRATVAGETPVTATGASKRLAEKQAAAQLLRRVGASFDE